ETKLSFDPYISLIKPVFIACISGGVSYFILPIITNCLELFLRCGIYGLSVILGMFLFCSKDFMR
ncbi:MAG: hypothetical protein IAC13_08925, partial [Firmicutes bacterium]|nr:hypothetical protein [Candidatus Scybalomonas excrementavium]